jgi:hypothetical protein
VVDLLFERVPREVGAMEFRYETFGKPIDGWMNKNVRLEDISLDAIMTELDKFDIILGQPWL